MNHLRHVVKIDRARWILTSAHGGKQSSELIRFFFQAEDGIRDLTVTGVQTCALPISKGAATYQLHMNPNRATKVLHRKPGAGDWEVVELEWAMDRVAELIKKTRDETFIEKLPNGKLVNMTPAMFALGGATLDNEFNHTCQKFWR